MKLKREKFKTLILLLLILSCLVLTVITWINEKLWPSGYNFFSDLKSIPFISNMFSNEDTYSIPVDNLSKPRKIVVTCGEMRSVYNNSDDSFSKLHLVSKEFISEVLSNQSVILRRATVPKEEWFDVLRNDELLDTKYIYVDFSISYTPELFAQVTGINKTWLSDVSSVKDFIIAPLGDNGTDMLFYVRDNNSNSVFKHYVQYQKKADIVSAISEFTSPQSASYVFSFEQNLDGSSAGIDNSVKQKIFLDSLLLLSSTPSTTPVITSHNPIDTDNNAMLGKILSKFGYSQNSLRHYTDTEETEYFVENYGTVKISSSGIIEYKAVNPERGYDLFTPNETVSLYESLNRAIEFSESLWHTVMPDTDFNVLVTSDLVENSSSPGEYKFTLDYFYEGIPITVDAPTLKNAVEIEVKNGKIVSYRHLVRGFLSSGETAQNISMTDALNLLYDKLSDRQDKTTVTQLFLSYTEDSKSLSESAVWCAKIADNDVLWRIN